MASKSKSKKEEILEMKIRLRGEVKDRWLAIKKAKGLTSDSELVRLLVSEEYRRLGCPGDDTD